MTNPTASDPSRAEVAADYLLTEARTALAQHHDSRKIAVHQLATGAAREVTARTVHAQGEEFNGPAELHVAHLLIAELATRLTEREHP